jgi:hypothetical protein
MQGGEEEEDTNNKCVCVLSWHEVQTDVEFSRPKPTIKLLN